MAEDTDRPNCKCHDEPMVRNGRKSWKDEQDWRCGCERREKARKTYDALEHVAWNRRLLQMAAAHRRWVNRRKREELDG